MCCRNIISFKLNNTSFEAQRKQLQPYRFVQKLAVFPGIQHLDVAGGTGDVAFRIYNAIVETGKQQALNSGGFDSSGTSSVVTVSDINVDMLEEGRKKAIARGIGKNNAAQFNFRYFVENTNSTKINTSYKKRK